LDNGQILREIMFRVDSVFSNSISLSNDQSLISKSADDAFLLNDKLLNGYCGWQLDKMEGIKDDKEGQGVKLIVKEKSQNPCIKIEINYLLYPNLPVIRKWIQLKHWKGRLHNRIVEH